MQNKEIMSYIGKIVTSCAIILCLCAFFFIDSSMGIYHHEQAHKQNCLYNGGDPVITYDYLIHESIPIYNSAGTYCYGMKSDITRGIVDGVNELNDYSEISSKYFILHCAIVISILVIFKGD